MKKFIFQLCIALVAVVVVGCGDKDDVPIYAESLSQAATSGSDEDVSAALNSVNGLKVGSVGTTYFVVEIPEARPTTGVMDLSSANVSALVAGDQIELKFSDSASTKSDSFSVVAPAGCTADVGDKVIISKNARVKSVAVIELYGDVFRGEEEILLEYDVYGRVSRIVRTTDYVSYNESSLITATFEYGENAVSVAVERISSASSEVDGGDVTSSSYTYQEQWTLENGRIVKLVKTYDDSYGVATDEYTYVYIGSQLQSITVSRNDGVSIYDSKYELTWVGGNLISEGSMSYEYNELLMSANVDTNAIVSLFFEGASFEYILNMRGSASKNLISKFYFSSSESVSSYMQSTSGLITNFELVENQVSYGRITKGSIIYE